MIPQDEPERQLTPDGRWRAEYRARQLAQRIATVQADLFGAPAIETYHPNTAPRPPKRTARNFKPRPFLTKDEIAAMLASAANWLRLGQPVKIADDSPGEFAGRCGVIWRKGSAVFPDMVYVYLDLVGNERSEKIAFVEVRDVAPNYSE